MSASHESSHAAHMMVIILMGVTGSGKSTIGQILSRELGWTFFDGDDFHPESNVEKMRAGFPLNDEDRAGWLLALRNLIEKRLREGLPAIIACSALKRAYRVTLAGENTEVRFVYLKGDAATISKRLSERKNHFMNPGLLDSQFSTLEEPPDAIMVDVSIDPEAVVTLIRKKLQI